MPRDNIDEEIGVARVLKVFQTKVNPSRAKEGAVGGCKLLSGHISRVDYFRVYRKDECIYEGKHNKKCNYKY